MNIQDAYNLFHKGTLLFSEMSNTGVKIDVPYLEKQRDVVLPQKIQYWKEKLLEYPEIQKWKKKEGRQWSLDSWNQMQSLLYNQMGYTPLKGKRTTNKETLKTFNPPFLEELLNYRKYLSCLKTFVINLLKEQVDGIVHADMSLIIPVSYRGSCSNPNLQNQPIRDDIMARILRRAFIPRKGFCYTEYDFKAMEVCINACYNRDPNLIEHLTNPKKDMHWDGARMCFAIDFEKSDFTDEKMFKKIRYLGKNGYIFPQFYGSWWGDCAYNLWQHVDNYTLPNGMTLKENLKSKGIECLGELYEDDKGFLKADKGTFYDHIKRVDQKLWVEMFPVYKRWKDNWYKKYLKVGQFHLKTGFTIRDIVSKNDCTSYPAQGAGFHVLLKTLIDTTEIMKRRKMPAHYVLQVHDSGLNEHKEEDRDEINNVLLEVVKDKIPNEWNWINVPLTVEAKLGKTDKSWYDAKEEVEVK